MRSLTPSPMRDPGLSLLSVRQHGSSPRLPAVGRWRVNMSTAKTQRPSETGAMKNISLGSLDVSRIGLGAMSMSGYYNIAEGSDAESIRTIHRALDLGVTHLDTAEIYGPFLNEELVGRAIKGRRDQVVLATKFGIVSHSGRAPDVLDSSPASIRVAVEG